MSLETLKQSLPDYAKDLKLNLASLATEAALTDQQRAGTFVASALATGHPIVIAAVLGEFSPTLSPARAARCREGGLRIVVSRRFGYQRLRNVH